MEALQPTFMLLPNFRFLPDKDVHLGMLLTENTKNKRPDPKIPVTPNRIPVPQEDVRTTEYEPWSWDSSDHLTAKVSLWAELSMITGIGGAVGGERGRERGLKISCDKVSITEFVPQRSYIMQALQDVVVKSHALKPWKPAIYMVTGLMVAHRAHLELTNNRLKGSNTKLAADGTPLGVPVKVGPEVEIRKDEKSLLNAVPSQPFILAYQLIRIRRRKSNDLSVDDENRWALFNDDEGNVNDADANESSESLEKDWEFESVTADTTFHEVDPDETTGIE